MIEFKNISVMNFENAIRGMRNPKNSWNKRSDESDKELALTLIKAGSDHRKFLRQIFISVDITAPRYWWQEMDTYKIGTTSNSCSTMHTLDKTPITIDMFSTYIEDDFDNEYWYYTIEYLEKNRHQYFETKDTKYLMKLKQALPEGFNQLRTWTANYEVLRNIYHSRKTHKLQEWKDFCGVLETFPYAEFITTK